MAERIFTVPDYYPRFKCKMGACRHACCEGWPVSISIEDYYRLIGETCSPDLRRRIDCALHLHEHPTREEYAFISPNYMGVCPLRLEDGRCGLHAELGENALSAVCRLYPRGVRTEGDLECSCANSCEAVIEEFLRHPSPLEFIQVPLDIEVPKQRERSVYFETVGREQEIRLYFIRVLQNRAFSMPVRLIALGNAMHNMQSKLQVKDEAGVDALLKRPAEYGSEPQIKLSEADMARAFDIAERLMEYIDERSNSIHDYGQAALKYFGSGSTLEKYESAIENLERVIPEYDTALEHMLVNHMFFERFPFQDRPETIYEEFAALCMIYVVLRFLCAGWVALNPNKTALVDVCAAAFRFFDHTSFDRAAESIFMRLGCGGSEDIMKLLTL